MRHDKRAVALVKSISDQVNADDVSPLVDPAGSGASKTPVNRKFEEAVVARTVPNESLKNKVGIYASVKKLDFL